MKSLFILLFTLYLFILDTSQASPHPRLRALKSLKKSPVKILDDSRSLTQRSRVPTKNPVPSFTYTVTGKTVEFDASPTKVSEGRKIYKYFWNFGHLLSKTNFFISKTSSEAKHTYTFSGYHWVTLTVTDNKGAITTLLKRINIPKNQAPTTDTKTPEVEIPNLAPTAYFTGVQDGGYTAKFDAKQSSDIDGTIKKYSWDFGDTNTFSSEESSTSHRYSGFGKYPVVLTVTDDKGATATDTHEVEIVNLAPTARADGGYMACPTFPTCTIVIGAGESTDPEGDRLTYVFTVDGVTSPPQQQINYFRMGNDATKSHTYSVQATDKYGLSDTVSGTIDPRGPPS